MKMQIRLHVHVILFSCINVVPVALSSWYYFCMVKFFPSVHNRENMLKSATESICPCLQYVIESQFSSLHPKALICVKGLCCVSNAKETVKDLKVMKIANLIF